MIAIPRFNRDSPREAPKGSTCTRPKPNIGERADLKKF
jgi:hypothetical protein